MRSSQLFLRRLPVLGAIALLTLIGALALPAPAEAQHQLPPPNNVTIDWSDWYSFDSNNPKAQMPRSITVSWDRIQGALGGYEVQYTMDPNMGWTDAGRVKDPKIEIKGVSAHMGYVARVRGWGANGPGTWGMSNRIKPHCPVGYACHTNVVPEPAPATDAETAPTSTSDPETTTAPTSSSVPASASAPSSDPSSAPSIPTTGAGQGAAPVVNLPVAVSDVQVARSDNALSVSWTHCDVTQPSCNGGSPFTAYLVNLRSGDGVWARAKTLTNYTSGSPVDITGGVTNAPYVLSVGVQNGNSVNWTSVSVPALTSNVSNLTSGSVARASAVNVRRWAGAFTTGDNPLGYTLKSVTAALRAIDPNGDLRLDIHIARNGDPSPSSKVTLTGTNPPSAAWTDVAYTCEGDRCSLSPNMTYFVVATASGGEFQWRYAYSDEQTSSPSDDGWAIGWGYYSDDGGANWDTWKDWQMFSVEFEQKLSPAMLVVSDVTDSAATLTLVRHPGAWWLRGATTDYACKAATGATEKLTGLSPGESYVFKAYSDPNCAEEIDTRRFTALPSSLDTSGAGAGAATLTSGDYAGGWYAR